MNEPQKPSPLPCDAKFGRMWCTLEKDHEGPHTAHGPGGVVLRRWGNRRPDRKP